MYSWIRWWLYSVWNVLDTYLCVCVCVSLRLWCSLCRCTCAPCVHVHHIFVTLSTCQLCELNFTLCGHIFIYIYLSLVYTPVYTNYTSETIVPHQKRRETWMALTKNEYQILIYIPICNVCMFDILYTDHIYYWCRIVGTYYLLNLYRATTVNLLNWNSSYKLTLKQP